MWTLTEIRFSSHRKGTLGRASCEFAYLATVGGLNRYIEMFNPGKNHLYVAEGSFPGNKECSQPRTPTKKKYQSHGFKFQTCWTCYEGAPTTSNWLLAQLEMSWTHGVPKWSMGSHNRWPLSFCEHPSYFACAGRLCKSRKTQWSDPRQPSGLETPIHPVLYRQLQHEETAISGEIWKTLTGEIPHFGGRSIRFDR